MAAFVLAALPLPAAPVDSAAKTNAVLPAVIPSVFIIPANAREGRDPFFPDSMRPYESAKGPGQHASVTSLRLAGISGAPDHRLAIINNRTFAAGDDGEVITSGGRLYIHCVEVKANSVTVEAGGQRLELIFAESP